MKFFTQPKVANLQSLQCLTKEQAVLVAAGSGSSSEIDKLSGNYVTSTNSTDDKNPHGGGRPPFN